MARKKKIEDESIEKTSFWKDGRAQYILGLIVLGFALFTLISLISYLFTWGEDQSLLQNPDSGALSTVAANTNGKWGFRWANFLMGHYFGIAAFGIPLMFGVWAFRLLRLQVSRFYKILFSAFSGMILFSVVFAFIFRHTPWKGLLGHGLGGAHGNFVSEWLEASVGIVGAGLLLFLLMLVWGIMVNKKFISFIGQCGHGFIGLFKRKDKFTDFTDEDTEENTEEEEIEEEEAGDDTEETEEEEGEEEFVINERESTDDTDFTAEEEKEKDTELVVEGSGEEPLPDEFLEDTTLFDPTLELSGYKRPTLDLLQDHKSKDSEVSAEELNKNKEKIVKTLGNYKIGIDKIIATIGPTVTLYEIVPKAGVRISSIKRLEDDIALSLSALGIRIIAPIPGKGTVGIEVPNERPEVVSMLSVVKSAKFQESKFDLPVVLGKTISNETYCFDLAKMPHLLVAGATGQGKSVGLNAILTSLLYRKHPSELKLVLVDPKKVELTLYSKIENHFLAKLPDSEEAIITDTQKVVYTLKSLCKEMDARYDLLKLAQVRNIKEYNDKFTNRRLNPLKGHRYLPFIVVIIDEFADLIMTAGREVEEPIARLAQLARAIGIHLVIATQRPTTNIITGLIKANFPARIAFRVISSIDSRTILDTTGANQLIGRGDMLVSTGNEMIRVQCAFVDTPEVAKVCEYIGEQRGFGGAFLLPEYSGEENENTAMEVDLGKRDKLFDEAARLIVQSQQGSTSLIQRKLNLGYNRAGRIMDQLEAAGIVGPFEGSKARQVLISDFKTLDDKLAAIGRD